jgi:hypothetical protein
MQQRNQGMKSHRVRVVCTDEANKPFAGVWATKQAQEANSRYDSRALFVCIESAGECVYFSVEEVLFFLV